MTEVFEIEYIPTGFKYHLPKEKCDELVTNEPENFKVTDENYKSPLDAKVKETAAYNKIVVETEEEIGAVNLAELSYADLKKYAKDKGIKASGTKEELLKRCIEEE